MAKKLVAYFSATGKTKAEAVAAAAGADLCAIEPEQPYTPEDLNWRDPESRCVAEMLDASARPRILAGGADVEGYDVIYLGFPIWNYLPAPAVRTFCEAHDFSGKTVAGMAELLRMAAEGAFDGSEGPLALPFASRFRATGRETDVTGTGVAEVVDDATGVLYLLAGGSLCPQLHADGSPQQMR